jgi:hypothetical protein
MRARAARFTAEDPEADVARNVARAAKRGITLENRPRHEKNTE